MDPRRPQAEQKGGEGLINSFGKGRGKEGNLKIPTLPSGRDDQGLMNRISWEKKLNVTEILP